MNLIFQVISLQGILGLSSLQSTHAMLPFWLKDGILKDSTNHSEGETWESLSVCTSLLGTGVKKRMRMKSPATGVNAQKKSSPR